MTERKDSRGTVPLLPEAELDDLFASVRTAPPEPEDALFARILADAETEQQTRKDIAADSAAARLAATRRGYARSGWFALFGGIGGRRGLAGLAAATVAGVWIGANPPLALESEMARYLGQESTEDLYLVDPLTPFEIAQVEG
ncbi:dihydroorotate dehydrogenase [Pseudooceanicola aestuarii]|uniref:dihydroorotate dehydrogenase n=1 Tax=Pseudooceanicola aestuarii TaxID=2697319 RepID=UPI001953B8E8|nr:dihydroorotate dehydrogenase [Pseudooceanicola aestuarii]